MSWRTSKKDDARFLFLPRWPARHGWIVMFGFPYDSGFTCWIRRTGRWEYKCDIVASKYYKAWKHRTFGFHRPEKFFKETWWFGFRVWRLDWHISRDSRCDCPKNDWNHHCEIHEVV